MNAISKNTEANQSDKTLKFSVDGQLIGELGERLVTRNHVALSELIKNAYDADSADVSVVFCDRSDSKKIMRPSIVLRDHGAGMDFSEVRNRWMRIATDNKLREPVSNKYGRQKTGNKGLGRFACQRLAHELVLETVRRKAGKLRKITVHFRWADFKPGSTLTEIPCEYTRSILKTGKEGTTLTLINLRDNWTQRDFDTLRRSTLHLAYAQEVQRKGFRLDPGFKVTIEAKAFRHGSGDLLNQVIDAGWGRLQGGIDEEGKLTLDLSGKYLVNGRKYVSAPKHKTFTGLKFDISYLVGHDSYVLNRDRKTLTRQVLSDIREHCGIRVYMDNFRVFPYGEPGDDWLGLDKDYAVRKSSLAFNFVEEIARSLSLSNRDVGLLRPRNENLLGRVFLTKEQSHGLQVKINREGFVDTVAYNELVEILRQAVEWMTVHYAYAKLESDRRMADEAEEEFKETLKSEGNAALSDGLSTEVAALEVLTDPAISAGIAAGDVKAKQTAQAAKKVIQTRAESTRNELSTLRALASTGPLLFTFSHEVSALIGRLDTDASRLRTVSRKISDTKLKEELLGIAAELLDTRESFEQLYSLFKLVAQSRQQKAKRHYAKRILEKLVKGTSFSTESTGISVSLSCDQDIKTPRLQEAEFISIAINLFTNAIKSTMASGGNKIRLQVRETRSDFIFEILDSGVGLAHKYWDVVLKPFISDPADKIYRRLESNLGDSVVASLGRGTGLGLSIVKGIVDAHKGIIEFYNNEGWSLGVRVRLPKE